MFLNQAILIKLLSKTKPMKQIILFISIYLTCFSLQAQETLTLEQAIEVALERNFDILLSKNDSLQTTIDRQYAYAEFLPNLNGISNRTWNKNAQRQILANGDIRESPDVRSNNIQANVALSWTLFDGMKMFIVRERFQQTEVLAGLQLKEQITNTIAELINTYYNIVRQKQQLRALEELISLNEERVTLANRKVQVGLGSKPELLQSKVDLNAQKSAQMLQRTLIEQLKEQLNFLMQVDNSAYYDVVDSIPLNQSLVLGQLQDGIEQTNWTLQVVEQQIELSRLALKERIAELFPTLTWNTAYNFSRTENLTVLNNFTPLFNRNQGFNYGFSLNIPIFNKFNTRKQIQKARIAVSQQELIYERERSLVYMNLLVAYKNYQTSLQTLILEEENIELAKENTEIAMERFKQGVTTNLELREAQKSLEDAYTRLIQTRYNTKIAETELLKLKGDLVK